MGGGNSNGDDDDGGDDGGDDDDGDDGGDGDDGDDGNNIAYFSLRMMMVSTRTMRKVFCSQDQMTLFKTNINRLWVADTWLVIGTN